MMKKLLSIIIILSLIVTMFVGCNSQETSTDVESPTETGTSTELPNQTTLNLGGEYTMATAGLSGTFYPYGGALCQIINRELGTNISATATSGGKENIALLANEEVDFALLDADMMSYALTGTEAYEGKKIDTFSSIASLFPQVFQIVVAEDSEINSIADLKGKRVSVGDAGSGTSVNAQQVLEAYGITFEDINVNYISFKESASAFQDNSLDAFIGVAGIPTSAVTETSLTRDVRLLSIDDEHMDILLKKYAFFAPYIIKKDVYGLTDDTETIAVNATLAALNTVSEEVVYNYTKAMFENQAELAEVNVKGEDLSIDTAINGLDLEFLHPGAAKYYKEVGILK